MSDSWAVSSRWSTLRVPTLNEEATLRPNPAGSTIRTTTVPTSSSDYNAFKVTIEGGANLRLEGAKLVVGAATSCADYPALISASPPTRSDNFSAAAASTIALQFSKS